MWDRAVLVEHELPVDADPDQVWALTRTLAALSAMPGRFVLDVPAQVAGTDRLCCLLTDGEPVTSAVHDVQQEVAGQMICWQTRSTEPAGKQTLTLNLRPRPRGSTLRLSAGDIVPRPHAISHEAYWQTQVRAWADSLRNIAEGRAPWPSPKMPAGMLEKCSAPRPLKNPVKVSAAAVIHAPTAAVWETVCAPESLRLMNPGKVAYAGHVPGTPEQKTGYMQCVVYRHPDERFTASLGVIIELAEGVSAVTQGVAPPHIKLHHLVTPVADGSRLELEGRWSGPEPRSVTADAARQLQEAVEGYKALIEEPA
jgi:hypothetical protein